MPFVTRFENVMGADPDRTSLAQRAMRKVAAIGSRRRRDVDYGFGTLFRDSDRLIVLSEDHRAIVAGCLPGADSRMVVIPPPANMQVVDDAGGTARARGRRKLGLPADAFVVAYIGYLHAGKGIDTLLRAVHDVARRRHDLRLVVIGGPIAAESGNPEGYLTTLTRLAEELGVADRVTWTGEYTWDQEDASLYLSAADVCALPFRRGVHLNNSSLASVAMHGLPIVTTRGHFLEDAFVHGQNAFLCAPEAPEALSAAIETLMADADLRRRLAGGSRELAREWFSWDRAVDRTLDALRVAG
jgi:glycosyltransferase involved in cell wall biosynthesis